MTTSPRSARFVVYCSLAFAVSILGSGSASGQGSQWGLRFHGTLGGGQDRAEFPVDDDQPGPDASSPCDVGGSSFSVEFWLRGAFADNQTPSGGGDVEFPIQNWRNGNIVVDRDILGPSAREWGISVAGGYIRFGTGAGDGASVDGDHTLEGDRFVLDGLWHHVSCVRDASTGTKRIFVDGLLDHESLPMVSTADLSYPDDGVVGGGGSDPFLVIGADKHDGGKAGFDGYIDELRIWNVARDSSQILSTYDRVISSSLPGLVGNYRFEAGMGTVLVDSSATQSPAGTLAIGLPGNGEWVAYQADTSSTAPMSFGLLPPGFQRSVVVTSLTEPTNIAFLPDGRMLVGERSGVIKLVVNGVVAATPFLTLPTNTENGERGLLGLAVDPMFGTIPYIYVFYTSTAPKDRVSRFLVTGNQASLASEELLWENNATSSNFHHGGGMAFANDGSLYVSVGDQLNSANAQSLASYGGKILRLKRDGGFPADNPFVGQAGALPEIFAFGLRHPFRITVDPLDDQLYIGEVGGNTNDAYEEVNVGGAGLNYGWPLQEGDNCYTVDCSPFVPAIWSYAHLDPDYYFVTPQGSVTLGPVYRDDEFPSSYQGTLFVADYANRSIRRLLLDDHGDLIADPIFLQTGLAGTPVDLDIGPDGALYYLTYGLPYGGIPDTATVYRIGYSGNLNQPPEVMVSATPTSGQEPLAVQFSTAGTFDPDASPAPLGYQWDFGDGTGSTLPNPMHLYSVAGPYVAHVMVDDGLAAVTSDAITISAGNAPSPNVISPLPTHLYEAGETIVFNGAATDVEDGVLGVGALSWRVVLVHNEHVHPFVGPLGGTAQGMFVIPSTGHGPENTYFRIELTAVDSDGLVGVTGVDLFPKQSLLSFASQPTGVSLFLDGEAIIAPTLYHGVVGFQHELEAPLVHADGGTLHAFRCWSNGAAREQTLVATGTGEILTALYAPIVTQNVAVAVTANNRNAQYSPATGMQSADAADPNGLCVGRDNNGPLQVGLQFDLPVPNGAFIVSARLKVTATANQAVTPKGTIQAYGVGNVAPFAIGSATPITTHAPLTPTSIGWVFPEFLPGSQQESPELSSLVQQVVDRPDWSMGNTIGFSIDGSTTVNAQWRCFTNFSSGLAPQLEVTYAVLPPSGGPCPLPCGFTTYGPAASSVHHLALVATGSSAGGGVASFVTTGFGSAPGVFTFLSLGGANIPFFGGSLLVAPAQLLTTFFVPGFEGVTSWNLPISPDPAFVGLPVFVQSAAVDPLLPQGAAFSNGVVLTICPQ